MQSQRRYLFGTDLEFTFCTFLGLHTLLIALFSIDLTHIPLTAHTSQLYDFPVKTWNNILGLNCLRKTGHTTFNHSLMTATSQHCHYIH